MFTTLTTATNAAGHPVDTTVGKDAQGHVVSTETLEWDAARTHALQRAQTTATGDAAGLRHETTQIFDAHDRLTAQETRLIQAGTDQLLEHTRTPVNPATGRAAPTQVLVGTAKTTATQTTTPEGHRIETTTGTGPTGDVRSRETIEYDAPTGGHQVTRAVTTTTPDAQGHPQETTTVFNAQDRLITEKVKPLAPPPAPVVAPPAAAPLPVKPPPPVAKGAATTATQTITPAGHRIETTTGTDPQGRVVFTEAIEYNAPVGGHQVTRTVTTSGVDAAGHRQEAVAVFDSQDRLTKREVQPVAPPPSPPNVTTPPSVVAVAPPVTPAPPAEPPKASTTMTTGLNAAGRSVDTTVGKDAQGHVVFTETLAWDPTRTHALTRTQTTVGVDAAGRPQATTTTFGTQDQLINQTVTPPAPPPAVTPSPVVTPVPLPGATPPPPLRMPPLPGATPPPPPVTPPVPPPVVMPPPVAPSLPAATRRAITSTTTNVSAAGQSVDTTVGKDVNGQTVFQEQLVWDAARIHVLERTETTYGVDAAGHQQTTTHRFGPQDQLIATEVQPPIPPVSPKPPTPPVPPPPLPGATPPLLPVVTPPPALPGRQSILPGGPPLPGARVPPLPGRQSILPGGSPAPGTPTPVLPGTASLVAGTGGEVHTTSGTTHQDGGASQPLPPRDTMSSGTTILNARSLPSDGVPREVSPPTVVSSPPETTSVAPTVPTSASSSPKGQQGYTQDGQGRWGYLNGNGYWVSWNEDAGVWVTTEQTSPPPASPPVVSPVRKPVIPTPPAPETSEPEPVTSAPSAVTVTEIVAPIVQPSPAISIESSVAVGAPPAVAEPPVSEPPAAMSGEPIPTATQSLVEEPSLPAAPLTIEPVADEPVATTPPSEPSATASTPVRKSTLLTLLPEVSEERSPEPAPAVSESPEVPAGFQAPLADLPVAAPVEMVPAPAEIVPVAPLAESPIEPLAEPSPTQPPALITSDPAPQAVVMPIIERSPTEGPGMPPVAELPAAEPSVAVTSPPVESSVGVAAPPTVVPQQAIHPLPSESKPVPTASGPAVVEPPLLEPPAAVSEEAVPAATQPLIEELFLPATQPPAEPVASEPVAATLPPEPSQTSSTLVRKSTRPTSPPPAPQPHVTIQKLSVGTQLAIQGPEGSPTYDVYAAENVSGPWELVASNVPTDPSGVTAWRDVRGAAQRFYKVEVSPAPGPFREYERVILSDLRTETVITFDSQGFKTQEEETVLDGQGRKTMEIVRIYDSNKGRKTQQTIKLYDPATGQVTTRLQTEVIYIADGGRKEHNIHTDAQGRKTADGVWVFDAQGRDTRHELTVYDPSTGEIIGDRMETSTTYMADGGYEWHTVYIDSKGRRTSESVWSYDSQIHLRRGIETSYNLATGQLTFRVETAITYAADGSREERAVITDAQGRKTREVMSTFNSWDRRTQMTETTYDLATGRPTQMEETTYSLATYWVAQRITTVYDLATGHRIQQVTRFEDTDYNKIEITIVYDPTTEQPKTRTTVTIAFADGAITTSEELWDPNALAWQLWKKTMPAPKTSTEAGSTVVIYDLATGKPTKSTTTISDLSTREVTTETVVNYDAMGREIQRVAKQFGFLQNGPRREEIRRVTSMYVQTPSSLWQTTITTDDYDLGGWPRRVVQRFYPAKDQLTVVASWSVTPAEEVTTTYDKATGAAQSETKSTFDTQSRPIQYSRTTFNPPPSEPAVVQTEFTYDPVTGRKVQEVITRWDPPHRLRGVAEQRYDSFGNLILYRWTEYDEQERPATRTTTEWAYTLWNSLSKRVDAQFVADPKGQWIPVTQTETSFYASRDFPMIVTITTYDRQGRKTHVEETGFDTQLRPIQMTTTTFGFDETGETETRATVGVTRDAQGRVTVVKAKPVEVTAGGQTVSDTGFAAIQQHFDGTSTAVQGTVSFGQSAAGQWQVRSVETTATVQGKEKSPFPTVASVKAIQQVSYTPEGKFDKAAVTSYTVNGLGATVVRKPDGAIEFYYPADPAPYVTRKADGTVQLAEGSGVTRQTLPDGTIVLQHPSGLSWWIRPDGAIAVVRAPGDSTWTRPTAETALLWQNDTITVTTPDGARAEFRPELFFGATTFLIEELERLQARR